MEPEVEFIKTRIPDVILVKPRVFGDPRGYFLESWKASAFEAAGIGQRFVQDNHSHSGQWILRGLHYQLRHTQGKLVRVSRGAVFDVAVDVRKGSPTFGQWVGEELSDSNHHMLWVPPGFAHGFLTLTEQVDFLYKCTDIYAPVHERVVRWDDPAVGIEWPFEGEPVLKEKDARGAPLATAETFP